jgi:hypothetical protein
MRLPVSSHLGVVLLAVLLVVAGCGRGASTPSAAPSPDGTDAWLRSRTFQAIPPVNLFAVGPTAVITDAGSYVTEGAVPAIYPGPLLPALVGRPISEAGRAAILAEVDRLGLLGSKTDFRSPVVMPGSVSGQIDLTGDGEPRALTGEPDAQLLCITTPCEPLPGTPEAFGELWRKLAAPESWLAAELGPQAPFVADAFALLVGPAPAPDSAVGAQVADWPLDTPLATFGGPVAGGAYRCGIVRGADADTLRPALEGANQLTQWVQDEATSVTFGLAVRPVIAGEDACVETFGGG